MIKTLAIVGLLFAVDEADAATPVLHGPQATAEAILRGELAFEARSESAGAPTAFREYLDGADGLEFGNGAPIRGAKAIADDMAKGFAGHKLTWTPQEVFASTGDMGVIWGVWAMTGSAGSKPVTGRYVTVWRQNAQGEWKALIDIGTADS